MLPTYREVRTEVFLPLGQLEDLRKETIRRATKRYWILVIFALCTIVLFLIHVLLGAAGFVTFVVMIFVLVYANKTDAEKYRLAFKENVVSTFGQKIMELCARADKSEASEYYCHYKPGQRINDTWMERSKLFQYEIDEIYGEDLFTGKLGLTDFQFSELSVIQKQYSTDSKGNQKVTDVEMFKGVLFIADFQKDFHGVTILQSHLFTKRGFIGKILSPLGALLTPNKIDRKTIKIKLENENFNEQFQVYTTDEVEARYLLSSNMMERILEFKKHRSQDKIDISFVDSCMFVAIMTNEDYFETNMKKEVSLEAVYHDLSYFFGFIEEFNLNTRIWNKR